MSLHCNDQMYVHTPAHCTLTPCTLSTPAHCTPHPVQVTISPGPGMWYEKDFYFVTRGEGVTVKRYLK